MIKNSFIENTTSYHDRLIESLQDQDEATEYLKIALAEYEDDGDAQAFLCALRNVTEARGGITKLSEKLGLNRQHLYRMLSKNGNPRLDSLFLLLKGLDFRLSIESSKQQPISTRQTKSAKYHD